MANRPNRKLRGVDDPWERSLIETGDARRLTRYQIIAEAKELVWEHGCSTVLFHTAEIVPEEGATIYIDDRSYYIVERDRDAIAREAVVQAQRVQAFLAKPGGK